MKTVRCAIYTRKSSDEGLEQSFNSLDAQREACAAYILSQASEGWVALPNVYDDGGLSGGTLERPALQRLLAEVREGRVDIIVVYKVDRLTRSLLDFSRLVEAFDAAGTSFVSVTQSFNTTTSMGRLTLNMLLSFAQFEREVTAERIRDKIAASKAKGMWMGGIPPLGYKPNGRSLAIIDEHADLVRHIFTRYLALGNVRLLADELKGQGMLAPPRSTLTGKQMGGVPFSRGQLYLLLKCRTYTGEVEHKGTIYPGLHEAIIAPELWKQVQERLASNLQGQRSGTYARNPSLLAGLLVDEAGEPLSAVHASRDASTPTETRKVRHRYYVSRTLQTGGRSGVRLPAREIERVVVNRLAELLDEPLELLASDWLNVPAAAYAEVSAQASVIAATLRRGDLELVRKLVTQVRLTSTGLEIDASATGVAAALQLSTSHDAPTSVLLTVSARLTRTGRAMRLVHDSGALDGSAPDRSIVRLLAQAHRYWRELRQGEITIDVLATREGLTASYVTRVLRLAFLAPKVTDAMLSGKQRAGVDARSLVATGAISSSWSKQYAAMLPAS